MTLGFLKVLNGERIVEIGTVTGFVSLSLLWLFEGAAVVGPLLASVFVAFLN